MYRKDEMTSKERMAAYLAGEPVDRMPFFLFLGDTAGPYFGVNIRDYYWDPETMVDVECRVLEVFGNDNTDVVVGLRGVAEALGSQIAYPENGINYLLAPVLERYDQLAAFSLIDPYQDGRLPLMLKAMDLFQKRKGKEIEIGIDIGGPVSTAAAVRGADRLMKDFLKDPENAHRLLDFVTDCALRVVEVFYREFGVVPGIADPMASASVLSPRLFREFAYPYLRRYAQEIKRITGVAASLHICGQTKALWPQIDRLEFGTFSVDNAEDIGETVRVLGQKKCIVGNLPPIDLIRNGTAEQVRAAAMDCYRKALSAHPQGFILAPGCQLPVDCPEENFAAMREAAFLAAEHREFI